MQSANNGSSPRRPGGQRGWPETRIGLVLGAGGLVGQAYHAGVLAALHDELSWDPRSAAVVVGSSAGSITGTLLRLGVAGSDLVAIATGSPLSPESASLVQRILPDASDLPSPPPGDWLRLWRLPSLALLARTARRPWAFRPDVAAMTMLPAGRIDLTARAAPLHEMVGHAWPAGLWVCATRRSDGGRVAFGRAGSPAAPLAAAIRASCAIPGYFAPVTIGGVEYFDGGVHSATNADVLRRSELDVVVVVSPMSTAQFPVGTPDALLRWAARRRLDRESRRLERAGCTVIRIEPGESTLRAMGLQPMSSERSKRVTGEAYQEVVRLIAGGGIHLPVGSAVDTVRTG
jgi:NTE family protein